MSFQAIAFDAYGTLFDVYSIGALAEKSLLIRICNPNETTISICNAKTKEAPC